jgi:hypothetical protein
LPLRGTWVEYLALGAEIGLNDAERVAEIEPHQVLVAEQKEADQWRQLITAEEQRLAEMRDNGYRASRSLQLPPGYVHLRSEVRGELGIVEPRVRTILVG